MIVQHGQWMAAAVIDGEVTFEVHLPKAVGRVMLEAAGRDTEARRAMAHLRALDPTLRIAQLKDWLTIHRAEDLALFSDALRKAGLPE